MIRHNGTPTTMADAFDDAVNAGTPPGIATSILSTAEPVEFAGFDPGKHPRDRGRFTFGAGSLFEKHADQAASIVARLADLARKKNPGVPVAPRLIAADAVFDSKRDNRDDESEVLHSPDPAVVVGTNAFSLTPGPRSFVVTPTFNENVSTWSSFAVAITSHGRTVRRIVEPRHAALYAIAKRLYEFTNNHLDSTPHATTVLTSREANTIQSAFARKASQFPQQFDPTRHAAHQAEANSQFFRSMYDNRWNGNVRYEDERARRERFAFHIGSDVPRNFTHGMNYESHPGLIPSVYYRDTGEQQHFLTVYPANAREAKALRELHKDAISPDKVISHRHFLPEPAVRMNIDQLGRNDAIYRHGGRRVERPGHLPSTIGWVFPTEQHLARAQLAITALRGRPLLQSALSYGSPE
jgi:hypothetical protein